MQAREEIDLPLLAETWDGKNEKAQLEPFDESHLGRPLFGFALAAHGGLRSLPKQLGR